MLNIEEDKRASQPYYDIRPGWFRENWQIENLELERCAA